MAADWVAICGHLEYYSIKSRGPKWVIDQQRKLDTRSLAMRCRRSRHSDSINCNKSPSDSPVRKVSRCSIDKFKTKPTDERNGLKSAASKSSPSQTRRALLNDDANAPTPDFAVFDCKTECANLVTLANTDCRDINAAFTHMDKIQLELEKMLVHSIDHQKKICGELTFLTTGDYPSNDISNRPMPVYQLRTDEQMPSCSRDPVADIVMDDTYADTVYADEDLDLWPPVNLPQKFWVFVREYLDPIDELYLEQWWQKIVQPICKKAEKYNKKNGVLMSSEIPSIERARQSTENFCQKRNQRSMEFDCSTQSRVTSRKLKQTAISSALMSEVVKSYLEEKKHNQSYVSNGSLLNWERRRSHPKKEMISPNASSIFEDDSSNKNAEEATFRKHSNCSFLSAEDEISSQDDKLIQFRRIMSETIDKFAPSKNKTCIGSRTNDELAPMDEYKKSFGIKAVVEDEVSEALKKTQLVLRDNVLKWKKLVVRIWNRLVAEYLRAKLERNLDKLDQELFDFYDKYYSDYPKRRPTSDDEREECRAVLQRRNEIAKAYYDKKYVWLGKWKPRKR